MASKIANRIFNNDTSIDPDVKKRLEEIQNLAGGIFDSRTEQEINDIKNSANFGGQGYLSGKTPFARLWTAVRITKTTDDAPTDIPIDADLTKDKFDFTKNTYDMGEVKFENNQPKGVIKETPLVKFPENGFKVYSLGMNPSSERNVYSPQSGDDDIQILGREILPSQKNSYTDAAYKGGKKSLKPPAGITNVRSTTQNSMGPVAGVLSTTVQFVVYDFEEFDKIYSKYFLRPGAKVFLDFGWTDNSSFQLYDVDEYLNDPLNFNSKIYGKEERDADNNLITEAGQIQQSRYGIEFIQGQVTKFNSTLNPVDGSYNCEISILSKNNALFDVDLDEDIIGNIKENMLSNIEFRVLDLAENALFSGRSAEVLKTSNYSNDEVKEWNTIANLFAADMLSSETNNVPTKLNTELGIFWKGTFTKDKKDDTKKIPQTGNDALYLSYGFIEDVLFNTELAKYTTSDNQFIKNEFTADSPIQYDSADGWTGFHNELFKRQKFLKTNTQLPFLYPEEWNDTYNTRKEKTPSDFKDTEDDKIRERIPIREIFIKLAVVKQAIKSSKTMTEVFNFIFKKMAESTGHAWDWGLNAGAPPSKTLGIVDKNYNAGKSILVSSTNKLEPASDEDFFNNMFTFEPFSPNTIVKSMNFNLSPGDGSAISSKIALQGLGANGRNIFPSSDLIDTTQTLAIIEDLQDDGTFKELLSVEYFPPSENISDLEKIFSGLESTADPVISDPSYLNHQTIYGGEQSNFSVIPASVRSYVNHTTEALIDMTGATGDKEPSIKPTEEYKKHKKYLENNNFEFSDSVYEYYTKQHLTFYTPTKPSILPIKLSIDLFGFTGFAPSDKFKVNNLPTRYKPYVFFQVMRISHTISAGNFTTNLDCVMRIRDDVKGKLPINTDKKHALSPYMLKNSHKLGEIEAVLPFLSYIEPNVDLLDKCKNVDFAYTLMVIDSGKTNTIKKQLLENSFVIKEEADLEDSGALEFQNALDIALKGQKGIKLIPEKRSDVFTMSKQYMFKKDKVYYCFIKGKNFLITDLPAAQRADAYFDIVLTKFKPPEKEATKK